MHVVVLTLNRGRGSGTVARDQAAALVDAGHEVTYMCAHLTDCVPGADNVDVALHSAVVPVHEYLPGLQSPQQRVAAMPLELARRYTADFISALDALESVDLIVAHHATITAAAAHAVAELRHIPHVVFVHGTGIGPRYQGGYDDELWADIAEAIEAAPGVIVTTEYVRDSLVLPLVNVPAERFIVLPCGVEATDFTRPDVGGVKEKYELPDRFVICPGALTYAKGPQNVAAASKFYSDLAPTYFIGDGDLASEVARALGARGRLLGFVPSADKNALIAAATLLVAAPVKREHFGIIYIEALAAGTVPVAYSGGGVNSIVTPNVGVLTERTPRALGNAVHQLLLRDRRRQALATAGKQRASRLYSRSTLSARFVAWIENLAPERVADRHVEASR